MLMGSPVISLFITNENQSLTTFEKLSNFSKKQNNIN